MPADIEQTLRRCLRTRAADVAPDPRTWQRVQQRIRRQRTLRWATTGVAVAAVAALVAVLLPTLNDSRIRFVPPMVDQPQSAPTPSPGVSVPAVGSACGGQDPLVLVAATPDGDLVASCASGTQQQVRTDTVEAEPAFSPDGALLAFTRRAFPDETGQIVLLDLAKDQETVVSDGYGPAFGPEGQLAWFIDQPDDGSHPRIVVREEPLGDNLNVFPVFGDPAVEFTARHLAWDAGGKRLWWEAGDEGTELWTADLDSEGPAPTLVDVRDGSDGSTYVAPSPNLPNQAMALRLCCVQIEGDLPVDAEIGAVMLTDQTGGGGATVVPAGYQTLQGLSQLPTPLDLTGPLHTAAAGTLDVRRDGDGRPAEAGGQPLWLPGDAPAHIVGDGNTTYLVDGYGDLIELDVAWTGVAVNPAYAPRIAGEPPVRKPEPTEPEPTEPEPTEPETSDSATTTVQVYFSDQPNRDCTSVRGYQRRVEAPAVARGALEALLAGPTAQERAQGAGGWFSSKTADLLNDVSIAGGEARLDFDGLFDHLNSNVGTSCGSAILLSQLNTTLKQFSTVERAVYSIDGDIEAFYAGLESTVPDPDASLPDPAARMRDRLVIAADSAGKSGDYDEIASLMSERDFYCGRHTGNCVQRWQRQQRRGGDPMGYLAELLRDTWAEDDERPDLNVWPPDTSLVTTFDVKSGAVITDSGEWVRFVGEPG